MLTLFSSLLLLSALANAANITKLKHAHAVMPANEYNKISVVKKGDVSTSHGKCWEQFKLGARCTVILPKLNTELTVDAYINGEPNAQRFTIEAQSAKQDAIGGIGLFEKPISELEDKNVFRFSLLDVLEPQIASRPGLVAELEIATEHLLPRDDNDRRNGYRGWINATVLLGSRKQSNDFNEPKRFEVDNVEIVVPGESGSSSGNNPADSSSGASTLDQIKGAVGSFATQAMSSPVAAITAVPLAAITVGGGLAAMALAGPAYLAFKAGKAMMG